MVKDSTLYDRLEVSPQASENDIKKAFLKLSKLWHPDKHQEEKEEASRRFQEIQQAKEVLLDEKKRELYDKIGMDALSEQAQQGGGFPGFPGGFPGFPGGFGFPGMNANRQVQIQPIVIHAAVTLEQIYRDSTITIEYPCQFQCIPCKGEGSLNGMPSQCPECNGQGKRVQVVQMGHMIQQHISDCPQCQGSGQFIPEHNRCKKCMGKGYQIDQKKRTVGIKAGLDHGNKVHLPQKGHFTKHGRGDLIVVLQIQKHPLFTRHKNSLYAQIELTLYQAMCGFDKVITHLDGRKLHIRHQSNTPFHTVRRIHEEGLRGVDVPSKGHLYIVFTIRLPSIQHLDKSIQDEWKQSLQSFDEDEVAREKLIQNDFSVFPTLLLDTEDSKQHIALFHHLIEENNEQQQHHQQHQQHQQQQHQEPHPGCVHQ